MPNEDVVFCNFGSFSFARKSYKPFEIWSKSKQPVKDKNQDIDHCE